MNEQTKTTPMTADDLQDLAKELRGSRSAPALMDAQSHFAERKMDAAHSSLTEAYETYCESRRRILRKNPERDVDSKTPDRDRQIRRMTRQQDKAREIIERFENFLSQLDKLADKQKARDVVRQITTDADPNSELTPLARDAITVDTLEAFSNLTGDRQLSFISDQFDFRPLHQSEDVKADAMYLLRRQDRCRLLHATVSTEGADKLVCHDLSKPGSRVELTKTEMVGLSEKRQLVLLLARG